MQVKVFIDLANDLQLLDYCKDDGKIFGLFQIYDAFGDEKYITMIAKHLWNKSQYSERMIETCGEEIYAFRYCADWIFEFNTDLESATLFKLLSPSPKAISIVLPTKTRKKDLFFSI